jgi:hypothetical protein
VSLRSLLDRRVSVVAVNAPAVGPKDAFGNRAKVAAEPVGPIRARRDQSSTDETIVDRDQQARTFVYLLELRTVAGDEVTLSGRDRIHDGSEVLEIIGSPELVKRRRLPHHWEARAEIVDG